MNQLLLIAVGGAIGSVLRFTVSGLAARFAGDALPWGTLAVNLAGSFAIGVLAGLAERSPLPPGLWPFLVTGLLGGFTTFSAFTLDAVGLLREGRVVPALLYVAGSNGLGLALAYLGYAAARP